MAFIGSIALLFFALLTAGTAGAFGEESNKCTDTAKKTQLSEKCAKVFLVAVITGGVALSVARWG